MNPRLKKKIRAIAIVLTILCMIMIFRFSMDDASSSHELSSMCVEIFDRAVLYLTGKDLKIAISATHYAYLELFFRKLAHMFIYFLLSINVMIVLFTFNMKMLPRMMISLLFCFIYACTDEFHQLFVDGRGASFFDTLFDSAGAFLGIIVALILYCIAYTLMTKYQKKKGIVSSIYDEKVES